jgi:hypothetical protein
MDILTETPEETAAMTAMENEAPAPEPTPAPEPAPAPAPEPAPVAAEAPKPAAPPAEKPSRMVPHAALHEERVRRQAVEQRIKELEQRLAPQVPVDQPPDENADPLAAIAWLKGQLRQQTEAQQRNAQEQAYWQDLSSKVQTRVNAYASDHPEYVDQVKYLREFRFRELHEGLGYPEQMAAQQVQREEMELGRMAVEQDLDPGEMVARLASVRGWRAAAAAAPAPAPAPVPAPVTERVARLQRGQRAAVSPSSAGGGGPSPEMTLAQLANLEGAAFDAAFKAHGRRLMDG